MIIYQISTQRDAETQKEGFQNSVMKAEQSVLIKSVERTVDPDDFCLFLFQLGKMKGLLLKKKSVCSFTPFSMNPRMFQMYQKVGP